MASIELRGGRYRLVFRHAGRRYQHPLGTADAREAEALRLRLEANLRDLENGRLVAPERVDLPLFLLSDGRVARPATPATPLSVAELLARHRAARAAATEANTRDTERIHAAHLEATLGPAAAAATLGAADLQRHVDRRARQAGRGGRPVSPVTIRKEVQTLAAAWNWAAAAGLVAGPFPGRGLVYPKGDEKPPFLPLHEVERRSRGLSAAEAAALRECLFLTVAEVAELVAHVRDRARHPWIPAAVALAAYTGARRSEILRARPEDVDPAGAINLRERKRDRTRRTTRRVPLPPPARAVLDPYLAARPAGPWLVCDERGGAITVPASNHHFERAVAGSRWAVVRGWHVLRHSFASNCAAAGVDQRLIDAWMGHQNAQTAARYRHLVPAREGEALARVFG